jgi:AraC-like DNA-binding protein
MRAMKQPAHTVSSAYVRAAMEAMEIDDEMALLALQEAGIAPDLLSHPSARVTERQFAMLYRALAVRCDDEMPRMFSRPLRPGALKFTCLSLLEARNLYTAMHRWSVFHRLLHEDFRLDVSREGSRAILALEEPASRPPNKPLALELMLKLVHGVASWLIDRRIQLLGVDFSFAPPPWAAEYDTLYPGPVSYGMRRSALHMDASYMDQPIRRTRSELPAFLSRAPEDWLFVPFKEARLEHRLREYAAARLPQSITGEDAAQALHLSVRTLHRRLAAEGTSLQSVKDQLRRDLAIQRLTGSQDAIAAIAAQLGFDGPASFHRAFKAWTGSTPGMYRVTPPSRR